MPVAQAIEAMADRRLVADRMRHYQRALKIRAGLCEIALAPQKPKREQALPFGRLIRCGAGGRQRLCIVIKRGLEITEHMVGVPACAVELDRYGLPQTLRGLDRPVKL